MRPNTCVACGFEAKSARSLDIHKRTCVGIDPDLFWDRVIRHSFEEGYCWLWNGATTLNNRNEAYGSAVLGGKSRRAHRVAWWLEHGSMPPPDVFVCHRCDRPLCCRPSHLFLGTAQENADDCKSKGRTHRAVGELNHRARLREEDVLVIRRAYEETDAGYKTIAAQYGVTSATIRAIVKRRSWKHL